MAGANSVTSPCSVTKWVVTSDQNGVITSTVVNGGAPVNGGYNAGAVTATVVSDGSASRGLARLSATAKRCLTAPLAPLRARGDFAIPRLLCNFVKFVLKFLVDSLCLAFSYSAPRLAYYTGALCLNYYLICLFFSCLLQLDGKYQTWRKDLPGFQRG